MARRAARIGLLIALALGLIGLGAGSALAKREVQNPANRHGIEFPSRNAKLPIGIGPVKNLQNHGGPIITSTTVKAIYWGSGWSNSSFVGDKQTGLNTFYSGFGGSGYAGSNKEYTGSNGRVLSGSVTNSGFLVDTSAGPTSAPSTAQIVAEVAKEVSSPVAAGYYPVYTDLKRGTNSFCAWHDTGTVHGFQVEVAFFFNLDGDSGCDPQDTWTTHSQGLSALANVSGHELSEAVTDPQLNAWYDRLGNENADKCAWTFHKVSTFTNGSLWKIQGNWSNAAYTNGRIGYANGGCIDGN
jgi:hypothetical protein